MENYTPYGDEWEAEMNKLPKIKIINLLRKEKTGTIDKKIMLIGTAKQAQYQVEGIINDFEAGIISKEETLSLLGEYTGRLMSLFWGNVKIMYKKDKTIFDN